MPRTIETIVYEYDELPDDKAKTKARQWMQQAQGDDTYWLDALVEDALRVGLDIGNYDLYRNEIGGTFSTSAPECAESITAEHGEECDSYKTAKAYLANLENVGKACDAEDGSEARNAWETAREEIDNRFVRALLRDYLKMMQKEEDYRSSDEFLIESLQANNYTFTASGKRFG